jgi:hypothetical protein
MAAPAPDKLDELLATPEISWGVDQEFWRFIERKGDRVYFEVWAYDGDSYVLELECDHLEVEPIRGRFVDPKTYECRTDAWPKGNNVFASWFKWDPGNFFICWPKDRGGVGQHAEWRPQALWRGSKNQVLQHLEFIRKCLMLPANGYLPRQHQQAA